MLGEGNEPTLQNGIAVLQRLVKRHKPHAR